jgi:Riboflavin kinase
VFVRLCLDAFRLRCPIVAVTDPEFRVLVPSVLLQGPVVAGYGRGSKELGIPTANLDPDAVGPALDTLPTGIYCGWATLDGEGPYKAVMSIGLCVGTLVAGRFLFFHFTCCPFCGCIPVTHTIKVQG